MVSVANPNAFVNNLGSAGTNTLTVGNNNATGVFGGVITNSLGIITLAKTGLGVLTLSGSNTYSGATLINSGTLVLSAYGSISTSPLIAIGGNAVFDVSGLTNTFALHAGQTLSNTAAAMGIISGNFNAASGTNSFAYTNGTPALLVTNGTFTLAATTIIKVNNTGPALTPGSYLLIAKAATGNAGAVAGTLPPFSVNGGGVVAGAVPALQIIGGQLYLVVASIPTTTALTLTSGLNPSTSGSVLTFTAKVQTNGVTAGAAGGNFVFRVDGVAVATNSVSGGQAAYTTGALAVGPHTITAEYHGDSIYAASTNSLSQTVNPAQPPVLGGIQILGGNLILTGTNGTAGANYLVLTATNLASPLTNWTILSTNPFGPGGSVNFTNPLNTNSPQSFYRLRLP